MKHILKNMRSMQRRMSRIWRTMIEYKDGKDDG